jgi:hypothetical protein
MATRDFKSETNLTPNSYLSQHGRYTATTTIFALVNRLIESKKTLDMSAAFDLFDKSILIPKLLVDFQKG